MTRRQLAAVAVIAVTGAMFLAVPLAHYIVGRYDVPFVHKYKEWSIGIYVGSDPLGIGPTPEVDNPVLEASDVTDVSARFVADPFLVFVSGRWYMFFEVMNSRTGQGDLGLATSEDGLRWRYERIVLDEPFHLSYPQVFEWNGHMYMIPETIEANGIRLYRAEEFPTRWVFVSELMSGYHLDPTVFRHADKWWMFTATTPGNDVARLYFSSSLTDQWQEHPQSPVVWQDASKARPGGRVLVSEDRIIRFTQDDEYHYGAAVRAFEVLTLTEAEYEEREMLDGPLLDASNRGWNAMGMHHVDVLQGRGESWVGAVDGWRNSIAIGRYY